MKRFLLPVVVILLLLPFREIVVAEQKICEQHPGVVIVGETAQHFDIICGAARKTVDYLAKLQLFPQAVLHIEVVDQPLLVHGFSAYGSYDVGQDLITIMSYGAIQKGRLPARIFGQHFDIDHYRGAVVHEVTHAIIQHQRKAFPVSGAIQEYFAFAVQLSLLPEKKRRSILSKIPVDSWLPGDTISEEYMHLQPDYFAVKSYKHLSSLPKPIPFIEKVLGSRNLYVYLPANSTTY